jgi:hypothetical protein
MSWGTCYSGSNNIHFDFPPIMNDGRNYASWQPGSKISDDIRKDAGITTNWQYRKYMVENADSIIRRNQIEACDQCCACPAQYGTKQEGTQKTPYLYQSCKDKSQPYGYETSDLKNIYLSKYDLQCRMYTPVLTQDQLIKKEYQNSN